MELCELCMNYVRLIAKQLPQKRIFLKSAYLYQKHSFHLPQILTSLQEYHDGASCYSLSLKVNVINVKISRVLTSKVLPIFLGCLLKSKICSYLTTGLILEPCQTSMGTWSGFLQKYVLTRQNEAQSLNLQELLRNLQGIDFVFNLDNRAIFLRDCTLSLLPWFLYGAVFKLVLHNSKFIKFTFELIDFKLVILSQLTLQLVNILDRKRSEFLFQQYLVLSFH